MFGAAESDEQATENRADGHCYADGGAEPAECSVAFLAVEELLNHADALWAQQASADALDEARDIERFCAGCESRGDGATGVHGDADEEEASAAEQVTGAAGGHEDHAECQRISGQHPLHIGAAGAQTVLDGGQRHVDDGHTDQRHEDAGQHDNKDLPPSRVLPEGVAVFLFLGVL